uniref:EF-hand domain-containing protein n=1 Tax=Calcidiscus leptoporus TaxID=127549 RepID=A0A7S0JGN2_9EUKA
MLSLTHTRAQRAFGLACRFRRNLCSSTERAALAARLASQPEELDALIRALPSDTRRNACLSWAVGELEDEFARADTNADGVLTWGEFRKWSTNVLSASAERETVAAPATPDQLRILFRTTMLPYIGFGCTDNALMVIMGDAIDGSIGVMLGLSTLAAAALGNAFSNGTGMLLHGFIERFATSLGLADPRLTLQQRMSKDVKNVKAAAGFCGVVTGCIIGMAPLLFLKRGQRPDEAEAEPTEK